MKMFCLILFLTISMYSYSQVDSLTIRFEFLEDDLELISKLENIQYIAVSCSDKNAVGKKFLLTFEEYEDGKLKDKDTSNLICEEFVFPILVGLDTLRYKINFCDRMQFDSSDTLFKIRLAGKLLNDTFKLIVQYPFFSFVKKFKGNTKYSLRSFGRTSNSEIKVPFNKLTPILTYTPPLEGIGGKVGHYCILNSEDVEKWYEKFKIKHYYVINILIK